MAKRTIKITIDDHENDKTPKKSSAENIKIGPFKIPTKVKNAQGTLGKKRKI